MHVQSNWQGADDDDDDDVAGESSARITSDQSAGGGDLKFQDGADFNIKMIGPASDGG